MIGSVLLRQTHKNASISTFVQSGYKKTGSAGPVFKE